LRDPAQRQTVLLVVDEKLLLERFLAARLPGQPPCQALDSRRVVGRPPGAQELADVLQAVRVGREIEVRVDHREDVAGTRSDAVDDRCLFVVRGPPDPVEEALLVAAVMIQGIVLESFDDPRARLPDGYLLGRVVGPEGVARGPAPFDHQQADQVVGVPVGHPLDVEVKRDARDRYRLPVEDEDLLLAEGESLEGRVVLAGRSHSPLAPTAGPVGVRELSNRDDPPAAQSLDLLPREPSEKAQIVRRLRDSPTSAPEFALVAVAVQGQRRGGFPTEIGLDLFDQPAHAPSQWLDPDPQGPASLSVDDPTLGGRWPQAPGRGNRPEGGAGRVPP